MLSIATSSATAVLGIASDSAIASATGSVVLGLVTSSVNASGASSAVLSLAISRKPRLGFLEGFRSLRRSTEHLPANGDGQTLKSLYILLCRAQPLKVTILPW